ncbi:hypothetical protein Tco_0455934 [Tanacetum coccineum]
MPMETSHDKIDKILNKESFVMELNALPPREQRHPFLRQPDAAAGALKAAKDAPVDDEGGQAVPAPVQAPLPPPPPFAARSMPQRLGRLEEEMQGLRRDVGSFRGLVERSITDQGRFSIWMIGCMVQLMEASGQTYQEFDRTFHGSSPAAFERCTQCRTGEASTPTA